MTYQTRYIIKIILRIFLLIIITLIIAFLLYLIDRGSDTYTNKKSLQASMSVTIRNGGSIDEVKHIFETRPLEEMPLFVNSSDFIDSSYRSETPLSHILADLLVEFYKKNTSNDDSLYITRLHAIVADYNAVHPFDALEEGQKYYLENIRQKLDTNYTTIQEDILKLGDELDRKNQLVSQYLDKSNTSYWISIVALIITAVLSFVQIWQNRKSGNKINDLLSSSNKSKDKLKDKSEY